jgi:site-specific recombinase
VDVKSEGRSGQAGRDEQENPGEDKGKYQAKRLAGLISCVLGLLLGLGGIVGALLALTQDVSSGVVAIVLGVLGYSLGARRLGVATVVLGTVALFFVVAASTGLIPGVAPSGHGYNG